MMYIQSRRRKLVSPFSSSLSDSFLLFSLHFPLALNSQSNCKRKRPAHSGGPNSVASTSSTSPHGRDCEGGEEQPEGNNYEVFLSFRGKDTRKGFTDYLYTSLVDAGIHVFRDNNELGVGEEFGPELLRSITQSKISIPIISEDYTSSKWCLRELAHMLKCKKNGGQIVLPIFYKVNPSQVRYLTGRLGDAINAHKKNLDEMTIKEWEEALKEVASLNGWESEKTDNGHEGALVKTVVRKVMSELKRLFLLNVPEQLVGTNDIVESIMSFTDAKSSYTRIIGIYGMGGIGKTTLAKVLYNKLSSHYEYRSFVANIRETSKHKGIACVQKKLISDIIGELCDVSNVDEGVSLFKSRFTSKKVLILFDDLDDNAHLNALVGDRSWFKAGSMVIITTRNKSILNKARADYMFPLNELPLDQSLILFSRHAFRKDSPPSDYEDISLAVVSTTGGLPLALEVIASLLSEKTIKAWKDTLKKLKEVPAKEVQETLRISYEALDYGEKQIFLDIACFFIGESQQSPTYMWDACGFFPGNGIEVLSHMSLIKVDEDGQIWMHDQLRDLGREIIRLENKKKAQRSRLWEYEDAIDVLFSDKGTSEIEALNLDSSNSEDWLDQQIYTAEQFKEMTNLRFLQVVNANFTGDFQNLLPRLRWLAWNNCPSDFQMANFQPKKLVLLDLWRSDISKDWGGWRSLKLATKLKVLNLTACYALNTIPNLSAFKSLEILILEECVNLEEIHPSIGDIRTLVSLNVNQCYKLKHLPTGVGRMEGLRELLISETNIQEIPISRGCLTKLETLNTSDCGVIDQLPESLCSIGIEESLESIGSLKQLKTLNASYCASLDRIPSSISHLASLSLLDLRGCNKLTQLPDSIGSLVSLQRLLLSKCHSLREIPNSIGELSSLTELDLESAPIMELPESIGSLKRLKTLNASYCASLDRIPSSISHLASLSLLDLRGCNKLTQLPDSMGSLVSLQRLLLSKCHLLREIPNWIGELSSLTELDLKSTPIMELPESIGSLKQLKTLNASHCASLDRIPSSISYLASLSLLDLTGCDKLAQLPDSMCCLVSLQRLLLSDCHSLREIPNWIGGLSSLTELQLKSTPIMELPESIGSLKQLKTLNASYCASLDRIPSSISHLASLSLLDLTGCDKLTQLPDSIGSLVSLQRLLLSECHSLREIPTTIMELSSLTELHLKSTPIMELPKISENMLKLRWSGLSMTHVIELLDDSRILVELQELRASGGGNQEGLPSNTGELVSPDNLDLDELQKQSKLRSRMLALECPRTPPAYNSAMGYQTADSGHVWKRSRPFGISDEDSESMADGKPRIADKSGDKSRIWKLTEINEPLQCRSIRLPDNLMAMRVSRLIYTNSGCAILALSSNAVHKHWKWQKTDQNLTGRATISVVLHLWRPPHQNLLTNDTSDTNPEDAVQCFALSKNECYLISASGGKIHLFNVINCKTITTFMPPPPPATFLAFLPQDNNVIAIGMEDSSILIYNVRVREVKEKLKGHQERITGLAFSSVLNVLVSSGADSQLCVWSTDGWEKQASKVLQMPTGRGTAPLADTRVQFHLDQIHLLVVHETCIAIYGAPQLECLKQWVTREASSPITHATYSCDGQSIYTSFEDGSIGVLTASTLRFRCRINAAAYIPPNPSLRVYPLVIAAHPSKSNQFALGLTDGSVYVLEPSESEGDWGTTTPVENGAGPSTTSGATASDEPQR